MNLSNKYKPFTWPFIMYIIFISYITAYVHLHTPPCSRVFIVRGVFRLNKNPIMIVVRHSRGFGGERMTDRNKCSRARMQTWSTDANIVGIFSNLFSVSHYIYLLTPTYLPTCFCCTKIFTLTSLKWYHRPFWRIASTRFINTTRVLTKR